MHHDRVEIMPETPKRGQEVDIHYKGILYENGADSMWIHYGFDGWNNATDLQMQRQGNSFYCKIKAEGRKDINLSFRDSANHWDNNGGLNWNFNIK